MAVLVIQELPATVEVYDEVNRRLGATDNPPEGLLIHTGGAHGEGVRVVDVWESEQAFNTFREQRLMPIVAEVVGAEGLSAGPPSVEISELHDVIKP